MAQGEPSFDGFVKGLHRSHIVNQYNYMDNFLTKHKNTINNNIFIEHSKSIQISDAMNLFWKFDHSRVQNI